MRIPESRTAPDRRENSRDSSPGRPKSLTSRAPDTLNRSVMLALMSALSCIRWRDSRLIFRAMRRSMTMNGGRTSRASPVISGLRMNIGTSVATRVNTSETTEAAVPTAFWASITSLVSRLIRDPVWVRVKNATGMRCTWS